MYLKGPRDWSEGHTALSPLTLLGSLDCSSNFDEFPTIAEFWKTVFRTTCLTDDWWNDQWTFPMCPLWSVEEGTNLKMRFFFKSDVLFLKFFAPPPEATHLTDVNEMWQDERDWRSPQTKFGVATLIFGDIRPPTISWEATEIWQSATSTTLRCEETPSRC